MELVIRESAAASRHLLRIVTAYSQPLVSSEPDVTAQAAQEASTSIEVNAVSATTEDET